MLIVHTLKSQNTINLKSRSYRILRSYHSLRSSVKVIANSLGVGMFSVRKSRNSYWGAPAFVFIV